MLIDTQYNHDLLMKRMIYIFWVYEYRDGWSLTKNK